MHSKEPVFLCVGLMFFSTWSSLEEQYCHCVDDYCHSHKSAHNCEDAAEKKPDSGNREEDVATDNK